MDKATIQSYDTLAASYAKEWEDDQSEPVDLQAVVNEHFRPGPTIDVGCGSGRETAWLAENGFDVMGVDASLGLIAEAKKRHPGIEFKQSILPDLEGIAEGIYTNVMCETVIMHLDKSEITAAVKKLVSLLQPTGVVYLSWRVTEGADRRDDNGRLYAAFPASLVLAGLTDANILLDETKVSASSKKIVQRIVAQRL